MLFDMYVIWYIIFLLPDEKYRTTGTVLTLLLFSLFICLFVVLFLFHSIWLEKSKYKKEKEKQLYGATKFRVSTCGFQLDIVGKD